MPLQISQFSDPTISSREALSLCGPAAAVAFARVNGRNPTLSEALDLAKQVGWTQEGGMNGVQNESRLLEKMGIQHKVEQSADPGKMAAEVQQGRPVTISTGAHYFTASDYDPSTGKFFVGTSGTDLKGGSQWMSVNEMDQSSKDRGAGGVNGAIYYQGAVPQRPQQQFNEANTQLPTQKPMPTDESLGLFDKHVTEQKPIDVSTPALPKDSGIASAAEAQRQAQQAEQARKQQADADAKAQQTAYLNAQMQLLSMMKPVNVDFTLPTVEPVKLPPALSFRLPTLDQQMAG